MFSMYNPKYFSYTRYNSPVETTSKRTHESRATNGSSKPLEMISENEVWRYGTAWRYKSAVKLESIMRNLDSCTSTGQC